MSKSFIIFGGHGQPPIRIESSNHSGVFPPSTDGFNLGGGAGTARKLRILNSDFDSRKAAEAAKEHGERKIPMKRAMINRMKGAAFLFLLVFAQAYAQTDPLPSWNDGPAKKAIVEF